MVAGLKSAVADFEPLELKSAVGWSQSQLVSSRQNLSQPQDRISHNSYPTTGTQVSRWMESAATSIQPSELEPAVGQSQSQLVSSHRNLSQPQDRISHNSYPVTRTRVSCRMESTATCIHPPELETATTRIQPPKLELAAI